MLVIEPLAEAVRCDPAISGLVVGQKSHKIALYADDILLFMSNPAVSVHHPTQNITQFSAFSE